MRITIAGTGYVGLSLAVLISKYHDVIAYDKNNEVVDLIKKRKSPFKDKDLENILKKEKINLYATSNMTEAFDKPDMVIVCTPTDYDLKSGKFDTSSVEDVVKHSLELNKNTLIVIKSTVPMGFTSKLRDKYKTNKVIFSPEFLRETKAVYDNLYPSRIIVGSNCENGKIFAKILEKCAIKKDVPIIFMKSEEAESVKLFSNSYLAMRISFFNELDAFCQVHSLDTRKVILGVSNDPRIGNYYNNPSFGYGGYCLPKDTKQLLDNYETIPNEIIKAIIESNTTRKKFIADSIINRQPNVVGIYRLVMKNGSDNFRDSAILDIINILKNHSSIKLIIYEPTILDKSYEGINIENDLKNFLANSDLIVANRFTDELENTREKVYTRDLFREN